MRRAHRGGPIVILLMLVTLLAAPGGALAEAPRTSLADIEDVVMCPVCGTSLALATEAPQAERQRELIRRLVAQGRTKEQVKAALVAEFGEEVLALPDDDGFDLAAYLVPALLVLLGATAVGVAALRWRRARRPDDLAAPTAPPPVAADARLRSDMERYEL
jgi:cytochrome c-type biogenesis protein CcmH